MCGIAGIFNFGSHEPADPVALRRATAAMRHRGPDDEGFYFDKELGLGNRRLSIIDLPSGHQPISNEDGTVWITFNGEIYNYRELRQELVGRGHMFQSWSDTETIIHLYEELGVECLDRLRGMFAFALWDTRRRRLFVARDRLGVKPLFYRLTREGIVFASELRALATLTRLDEIDPQSVYDFFAFRYVPGPGTLYKDVLKLMPGHRMVADSNGSCVSQWWDVVVQEDTGEAVQSQGAYEEQLIALLEESIRLRLIADVPVGVLLSGGIDSSAIVGLAAEASSKPLRTFSVGFEEPRFNELPAARRTAQVFHTDHQEVVIQPRGLRNELERLVAIRHEPVAEPTDVALYGVSRLAAGSVKVVLAGEGGDELFAGYPKYAADRLAGRFSRVPKFLVRGFARILPYQGRRLQLALETLSIPDEAERAASWFSSFTRADGEALFSADFLAQVDPGHPVRALGTYLERASGLAPIRRLMYADLKVWLPDNLLVRGDAMTMAASIEERVPFLDHHVVEFAARIPASMLTSGMQTKTLLKHALRPHVPAETLLRPKVGFTVPVGQWFRTSLRKMVEDLLLSPEANAARYFNRRVVKQLVDEHVKGVRDRQKQLWALINFELWLRQEKIFHTGDTTPLYVQPEAAN